MMSIAIAKTCGPGRPKDLEKRAAILQAAKQLFTTQGFDGTSMDAIAGLAGVSKLTVYSHYRDKERLFVAAVECVCQEQMPAEIFNADLKGPIRKQLMTIARAFFALITSEAAVAVHRTIVNSCLRIGPFRSALNISAGICSWQTHSTAATNRRSLSR